MEPWMLDLLKLFPVAGPIIAVMYLGMRWIERESDKHRQEREKCNDRMDALSNKWMEGFKEVGEKCHEAHEKVATMYKDQADRSAEVATGIHGVMAQVAVHLDQCAKAQEQVARSMRERVNG